MVKFLDLQKQYLSLKADIDRAIASVIGEAGFINSEFCAKFERDFAHFQGIKECVGVANGTDAIEIALEAFELPKGSEVVVPANTFIASSEAVTRSGHRVVFCDSNSQDYTLSIGDLLRRIGPRTRAIIAVHLYGHPCDMKSIMRLAEERGIRVVEDCAQAHGAEIEGKRVGTFGDIATFSFYPGKILGAYGDAGALGTGDERLARRCRMIANHGRIEKYDHLFEGRNSRLDGIQAAILSAKLPHVENWIEQRIRIASYYQANLEGIEDLELPVQCEGRRSVFHLYVVRTKQRDRLRKFLGDRGIETGIHYPVALPKLKAYEYMGQAKEPMFANSADSTLLSLPIGEHLETQDAREVVEAVRGFFRE